MKQRSNNMAIRKRNPLRTRNDRIKLKPLTLTQLSELRDKSSRPKDKDKIQRRINNLNSK